jgi:selT/selW/selH-like putative selenoprotein
LAKAIESKFGIKPQLIKSGGGLFEVRVDGRKIFSKEQLGRFPENDEILTAIAGMR